MNLSDVSIYRAVESGRIGITPFNPDNVQPASVDLTVSGEFLVEDEEPPWVMRKVEISENESLTIYQHQFVLASTAERVELGDDVAARVEGKSSLGRQGLLTHVTAGFIDPGFRGNITLELCNLSRRPFTINKGMKICQLSFHEMTTQVMHPYGSPVLKSKYQDSEGTVPVRGDGLGKANSIRELLD